MTSAPLTRTLHEGWTVTSVGGPVPESIVGRSIPATVPGSVHTDLMAAGLIVDPYLDANERLVAWVGAADWRYSTTFEWSDGGFDRIDLVFEGLDTVAAVELNGVQFASTANMHRTYRIDATSGLREGPNELVVTFSSPLKYADRMSLELGYRPHVNHHPYNAIRKMACSFGWDWGLDTATVGLWRPVSLHSWNTARLSAVRPLATADGHVAVHVDLEYTDASAPLTLTATIAGATASTTVAPGSSTALLELDVADARAWWPRGYGEQPLYDLALSLETDGAPIDSYSTRLGFRSVSIDTAPDEIGAPFTFVVNGQPIYVKGANWIPDDAFPHRVDRARYAARLDQAEHANLNLLRIWGGGIFESDDFYAECDERGIMVWQDFLFACASYSEEEPMRTEVLAEVRDNVIRLLPHPSLVLWNGNNENIWGYYDWGWENRLEGKTWGLGYYLELFPALLAELDPHRPYTPGSPFSPSDPSGATIHPNDPDNGSSHQWEHWNRVDYPDYRNHVPRFVAEFGWQGPPAWSTLERAISDSPLTPESPGMLVHQKALDGNDKLTDGLVAHLPFQNDMDDWHWAMSLNQANAVGVNIEHLRSWSPRNRGAVVWQLNDCWPVTSWAAVDGDGAAKPLLYAIKHGYAPRLVTVQPREGGLAAIVHNDSAEAWSGDLVIDRRDFSGAVLESASVAVEVEARGSVTVPLPPAVATPARDASEFVVASLAGIRGLWFFTEARDSALAPAETVVSATARPGGYDVTITASTLVRDLALLVDKLDPAASVDDMLVTLLPGESVTLAVTTGAVLTASDFDTRRVLRSANQLLELLA
ncbi:glycoside hydrolase family 2 protein [soil metagenome]